MKKVYQVWPGNNRFLFCGRFVTGPDKRYFYFAIAFITLPAIYYCALIWPVLFWKLHPYISVPLALLYFFLLFCMYAFMFLTRYRDPGIIPRSFPIEYPENPWDYEYKKPAEFMKIQLQGDPKFRVKYCETCALYRPPRCTHCAVCNNCVERFDHHCPWVGNCIGRRNYQTFIGFVWSVIMGCVYIALLCVAHFIIIIFEAVRIRDSGAPVFLYILGYGIWSVLMFVYCCVAIGFVGFLGSFHCTLLFKNQTTNEQLKHLYAKKMNPFSFGPLFNFLRILFPPMYPSYHELRTLASEEESRYRKRTAWPLDKKKRQQYIALKKQRAEEQRKKQQNSSPSSTKKRSPIEDFREPLLEKAKSKSKKKKKGSKKGSNRKGKDVDIEAGLLSRQRDLETGPESDETEDYERDIRGSAA